MFEQVEKHERLEDFAQVGRAHQTRNGAVRPAASTLHDRPRQPALRRRDTSDDIRNGTNSHDHLLTLTLSNWLFL
jgi:hypothetical protein